MQVVFSRRLKRKDLGSDLSDEQQQLAKEFQEFQQTQPLTLSDEEQDLIRHPTEDIPAPWASTTTTPHDRQQIVRMLIDRIEINIRGNTEQTEITIFWSGGFTSRHRLLRTIGRYIQRSDYDRLLTRILALKQTSKNLAEVAGQLRHECMISVRGTPYTAAMLRRLLRKQGIHRPRSEATPGSPHLKSHEWWLKDLARHLGIPHQSLTYWRKSEWLHARHVEIAGGRWIIWADESEIERLKRLRNHHQSRTIGQPAYPVELTTPKPRPNDSPL